MKFNLFLREGADFRIIKTKGGNRSVRVDANNNLVVAYPDGTEVVINALQWQGFEVVPEAK